MTDLEQLEKLEPLADDAGFQEEWRAVKQANKVRLAANIESKTKLTVDPAMMFDVQVKRIHEYKRQLLNVLHAIHLYDRIQRGDGDGLPPRVIIIGGKAAPGYEMAKDQIKLINNVAKVINTDPAMRGRLQLVFYPDYNVSAMELICPAADLSEQVSTAGKEASGTGNMKFMMNGAVTIGTLDGANVEILEAVGEDNFFLFGLTVDEIPAFRENYDPQSIIDADRDFRRVMRLLDNGHFNHFEPGILDSRDRVGAKPDDPWMTAADFRSYIDAQEAAGKAYQDQQRWTRMSILNSAKSGRFSTDRTMRDYNRDIWHLEELTATGTHDPGWQSGTPGGALGRAGCKFRPVLVVRHCAVELCLFDASGQQVRCFNLPGHQDGVWSGYLPACEPGQRYAYRAHGPVAPEQGLRFNPSKLLIDPYARALDGSVPVVRGPVLIMIIQPWSGRYSPTGPTVHPMSQMCRYRACRIAQLKRPRIPWTETIIYEANVRGYTMRHPDIPEEERGKFRGLSNGKILEYLKALGITSLELMPVHSMIDEGFLIGQGLKNFWGYNSINFFTPESRFAIRGRRPGIS